MNRPRIRFPGLACPIQAAVGKLASIICFEGFRVSNSDSKSIMKMQIKKFLIPVLVVFFILGYLQEQDLFFPGSKTSAIDNSGIQAAYENRQSDVQVKGEGTVTRVLRDDLEGSRHQKFILKLDSGQTLLISHNIDLAPRIDQLRAGDSVEFFGEYEWNPNGGVVHWTHHDPRGRHVSGWLKHRGKTYQ